MSIDAAPRTRTRSEMVTEAAAAKNAILVEEILFLLGCDVGEAGILHALGYTGKAEALKRRLTRIRRHDLIPRIFEADALYHHRHAPMGIPEAHRARKKTAA